MAPIQIIKADLRQKEQAKAFLQLTAGYMRDAMGGSRPWTNQQEDKVLEDLREHPSAVVLLARSNTRHLGVCTLFCGYSTFLAGGVYNIHDLYVLPEYRNRGIGGAMLRAVEKMAREEGAAKITLEVRTDNHVAQKLYSKEGYHSPLPAMLFWSKRLVK